MGYQLLTPPVAEPVSLAQAKNFLRVDFPDDDALITVLLRAARAKCEGYTERFFVTQTWRMYMDAFPGYEGFHRTSMASVQSGSRFQFGTRWAFSVPFPPCQSVVQVQYIDANGITQTLVPNMAYYVDFASQPARVAPAYATFWPVTQFVPNAAWIDFVCGYGAPKVGANGFPAMDTNGLYTGWTGMPVPDELQLAIMMLTSIYYDNRGATAVLPDALEVLLYPFRDMRM